jgi:hypothetical protein
MWEYNIGTSTWIEHKDPKTSAGDSAEAEGQSVQRAAEGAGFSVATLGRGWYFAGHLDDQTTEGWSNQIDRVYLKSLLEFTFPGFSNQAVENLKSGNTADEGGAFRNITDGGTQGTSSFPQRADGVLVYIPGFSDEGILLGLTGGDNDTFVSFPTWWTKQWIMLTIILDTDEHYRCVRHRQIYLVQAEHFRKQA